MKKSPFAYALAILAWFSISASFAFAEKPGQKMFGKGNSFKVEDLPQGKLKTKLGTLNPQARGKAMEWLHTLQFGEFDAAEHLRVDNGGGIFMVCPDDHGNCEGHSHGSATPEAMTDGSGATGSIAPEPDQTTGEPTTANAAVSVSSPPAYHSRPTATRRIYLDFNGGIVTGTAWNNNPDYGSVSSWDVKVWSQDTDRTTFNDAEQAWMKKVWQRVSEDYASFDVDVTTDVAYDPDNYTGNKDLVGWLLICEQTDKNNVTLPHSGSGGVAYVNVFGGSSYSPTYQPAWVSSTNGGGSESIVAEAASHEMGHNMGLNHDANSTQGYYGGHGSGDISWGPIMGTGYNRNVSQWSKGEYFDANNLQDDLAVIAGKVGYRGDDHGNTPGTARPLVVAGGTSITSTTPENDPANATTANKGVIERNTDVDVFSFVTGVGTVTLNANPWKQPSGTFGGNLDILLELYNEAGTLVASNNAADRTYATITTTLAQGLYYLHVRNSGTGTPTVSSPSGYTSYGSVGQYFISGTIIDSSGFVIAPVAEGQFTNLTQSGQSSHQFTVIYSDNVAIDVATIGTGDVRVTGPGGYDQLAQLVSLDVATNGTPRSATYAVTPAAGGNWLPAQNGSYIVSMLASQVKDTEGAFVAAGSLGQFNVAIAAPLYSADMNSNPGWTLNTGWEYGTPTYTGGSGPTSGYTGTKILAVDLAKNYAKGLSLIYATTPVINASGTTSLTLSFRRWLGLKNKDTAKIEVSTNGSTWIPVWSTTAAVADSGWQLMTYALPQAVVGSSTLRLRWGLSSQSGGGQSSTAIGWNIDDVEILANGGADASPPVASLSVGNIIEGGSPSHSCSVTYADATAVALSSLDTTDLLVVGPSGPVFPLTVEFTGADLTANGTPMTGNYSIAAPGGTWDFGDNGTYTVTLQDASVSDTLGNTTSETVLGTFTVNISNLTPGMLVVTPAGDLSASGNVGGPFSPASLQYTLKNTGQTTLNWTAGKTANWVSLSATSGTLLAGASTTVTVSFAVAANSLTAGSYNDTVSFSNITNNNGNTTRGVSLTVAGAGVLAVTPAGGLSSAGTFGGPFSPASQQYTLNNTGGAPINWTATKTAAWVGLSATSGTLAAGATTTVTVSFASAANSLTVGNYSDTVSFANTTNSNGNTTRSVALTVNAIPVTVTLSNLNQTYNGSPKPVTVTTNPTPITYSVTYAGSATVPTNVGTYAVVATITQPNYSGSASGSLVIAKASQTITFGALASVSDAAAPFTLGATASSGLTVSYASSNTSVATVSGNMVTIVGAGNTTITASQTGGTNYNAATDVPQTLTVTRANPLANPGGPYTIFINQSLTLNGSASLPSGGATIITYAWDLNNDGTFGDVTGANPAAISYATLTGTWGMVSGPNTIQLRVTDSAAKTSIVSTAVNLVLGLTWDANGTLAGQTNGGGAWLGANQWWDGSSNANWVSGSNAVFGGPSTDGGSVTLASPTSAGSITFNTFTSTYTLGTAGQALTVSGNITNNSASGAVIIISPLTLGTAQTWQNDSSGLLKASGGLDNGGRLLTFDGAGSFDFSGTANLITGAGGITMNGAGRLVLGAGGTIPVHNYSGTTTINNGVVMIASGNLGSGNLTLNGGVIETYWATNFTRALGGGAGQMQLTGGASGFSMNGSNGASVIINNDAAFEVVWGSTFFKPSTLVLQASSAQNSSSLNFQNKIDLNGATRTIFSSITTGSGAGSATISGVIRNSTGTAGITKTGTGLLILSATNTYNGNTTVSQGTLRLNAINANNEASTVTIASGATLNLNFTGTDTVGKLFIGATEQPAGVYKAVGSAATGTELAQITGTGTLTVTGAGDTIPPTLASSGIVDNKGGAPITVNTLVTYTVTFSEDMDASTVTAAAFGNAGTSTITIGAITETSPTSGVFTVLVTPTSAGSLQLKVNAGAVLKDAAGNNLNTTAAIADNTTITVQGAYTSWAGGPGFNTDSNSDGITNGVAWVVGASNTSANAASLLPTTNSTADVNYLVYTYRRIDVANLDPNTTITVEYGSTLSGWSPATNDGTNTIVTASNDFYGAGIDKVEVRIKKTLAQNGKLFSRLKVVQSSP